MCLEMMSGLWSLSSGEGEGGYTVATSVCFLDRPPVSVLSSFTCSYNRLKTMKPILFYAFNDMFATFMSETASFFWPVLALALACYLLTGYL